MARGHGRARLAIAALALAVAGAACRGQPGLSSLVHPAAQRSEAYLRVLERWTRSGIAPDRADIALSLVAVYKSAEFRDAYVDEYAAAYRIPDEEQAAIRAAQEERAETYLEFHALAYTADHRLNDLAAQRSPWTIFLEFPDGRRLAPEAIERLERKDVLLASFYPVGDAWSRAFNLRFARPADLDPATMPRLVATGALGALTLEWK